MLLLLSDKADTAAKIKEDLTREGFTTEVVKNFAEAIVKLNSGTSYELILIDFDYAEQDVFDVCQKIKKGPAQKIIPLVGILNRSRVADKFLAFELGVDDFILMPYSPLEFQLKIRSLHRIAELQTRLQQKEDQLENLQNIQHLTVTLNHYINNALTPLYFAVQMAKDKSPEDALRIRTIARETVEFISKVLQTLQEIVDSGKIKVLTEGVYKDMMLDIEQELDKLIKKVKPAGKK